LHVTHGKSNSYIKSNCGSSPCVNAGVSATKKCFDDLKDEAKKAVIEGNRYINVQWEWYKELLDTYLTLGIRIGDMDLERDYVETILITTVEDSIKQILMNISPTNDLYKLAESTTDPSSMSAEEYMAKVNPIILKELKEAYGYLLSDDAIADTLRKFRRAVF